ncbi:MAG: 3-hydroxyacyl-CoA dehydrogenase family protein [Chloroflexota bacterium]|nr:3-hydroxyacyl-CoA dehydrogenase family protein [Chloroflexota bacterium]MDE2891094.1 3-hydroxyacyl-CoA dehydrogenase family protein [Chloroflexota bacterium]
MSDSTSDLKRLGVLGGGTMGSGIAQTALLAGVEVTLVDVDDGQLERAQGVIEGGVERLVSRDRISAEQGSAAIAALTTSSDLESLAGSDGVIEAVSENVELKRGIFERLETVCAEAKFIASNTSSLSIQEIAERMQDPSRVVGLHYFNPAQVLPLVEVVVPLTASDEAVDAAWAYVEATGKTPVRVKDTPAFIVNRLLVPFCLEALRMWESGVATAEDIDRACQLGLGHSMGPLATADLVGLDVLLDVAESMQREIGDPNLTPPTILRRLVSAGRLGRKTGRGIFEHGG